MFCTASAQQGRLKVAFRYFYLLLDSHDKSIASPSLRSTGKTHHARFIADSGGLSDALQTFRWSGYSSRLCIVSLCPVLFLLLYSVTQFLILFLGGVALRMANRSSRSTTLHAGIISARGREIYFL